MLATSKNVLFPGHNHLLTTDNQSEGSSVPVVSRWLWPGDRTFLELASMVVTWWRVAFCAQCWREHGKCFQHIHSSIQTASDAIEQFSQTPCNPCDIVCSNGITGFHCIFSYHSSIMVVKLPTITHHGVSHCSYAVSMITRSQSMSYSWYIFIIQKWIP